MVAANLTGQYRFAGARRPLNDVEAALEETASKTVSNPAIPLVTREKTGIADEVSGLI
jgi:hypothetical protein